MSDSQLLTKKDKLKWLNEGSLLHQDKAVDKTFSIKRRKEESESWKSCLFGSLYKPHKKARIMTNQIVFFVPLKRWPTNKDANISKMLFGQIKDQPKASKTMSQNLVA